jgi:hypothetical protein
MSVFDTLILESDNPTTLEVVINTDPWSSAAISRLMSKSGRRSTIQLRARMCYGVSLTSLAPGVRICGPESSARSILSPWLHYFRM